MAGKRSDKVSVTFDKIGTQERQVVEVPLDPENTPVRIDARGGLKGRMLLGHADMVAPDELLLQRSGDDLLVMFDGVDPENAQLRVEGLYEKNADGTEPASGSFAGLAEDGTYYDYVSSTSTDNLQLAQLSPGVVAAQALGVGGAGGTAAVASAGAGALPGIGGGLLGLGGAGLGAAAAAAGGGGGGGGSGAGSAANPGGGAGGSIGTGPGDGSGSGAGTGPGSGSGGGSGGGTGTGPGSGSGSGTGTGPGGGSGSGAGGEDGSTGYGNPGAARLSSLGKNSGSHDDFVTRDGNAGRALHGTLGKPLSGGGKLQVSSDGGASWQDAVVDGRTWTAVDMGRHDGNWTVRMKLTDAAGQSIESSQAIILDRQASGAPVEVSRDQNLVSVNFAGTGAIAGDTLRIAVGAHVVEKTLSTRDVQSGRAEVGLSPHVDRTSQGHPLSAAIIDNAGNISGYRVTASTFEDFNSPAFRKLDGSFQEGDLGSDSAAGYFSGGLRFITKGPMRQLADGAGEAALDTVNVMRITAVAGGMREISLDVRAQANDVVATFYNAQGGVLGQQTLGRNTSGIVSLVPGAGESIAYLTLSSAGGRYRVGDIDYKVDSSTGHITMNDAVFKRADGSQVVAGGKMLGDPIYLGNLQISSQNTMFQYSRNEAADATTGNFLRLYATANTTFMLPELSRKVSFDVTFAGGSNEIRFYNARNEVINTLAPQKSTADPQSGRLQPHRIDYEAAEDVAYFTVKGSDSSQIDNISTARGTDMVSEHMFNNRLVSPGGGYYGTQGNDLFDMNLPGNLMAESKMALHGGDGIDTLRIFDLTGSQFDLSAVVKAGRLSSVEVIDLQRGQGRTITSLKLSLGDVLELGGRDLFVNDGKIQFMIKGDNDRVELSTLHVNDQSSGSWSRRDGQLSLGGQTYYVYDHSLGQAELLVTSSVQVTLT